MTSDSTPHWSTVFFEIEEIIFQVPRYRFIEHSTVFADMFQIPQAGPEIVEGKDEEHPIKLDHYKAEDFRALIKTLYPAPLYDVEAGSYALTKEEWVGVLNLSTRWQMTKIREHAIVKLSEMSLTAAEKVALSRTHKVAKWLKEGLNEIVNNPSLVGSLDDLMGCLGLETACRVLWIQNQFSRHRSQSSRQQSSIYVTLRSLQWECCSASIPLIESPVACESCSRPLSLDDPNAIFLPAESTTTTLTVASDARVNAMIDIYELVCARCLDLALRPSYWRTCPSCDIVSEGIHRVKVGGNFLDNHDWKFDIDVSEAFKEELKSYEWWNE